ncbi:hypothetical protein [Gottfriedia acidiceleris]|uniref:hypothetical protein n=1 Tax=Gottfriedia acidiceleris TaxID=371036 RepID=UPI002FFFB4E7
MGLKYIYKKSLAFDLIKLGHDLRHTTTNKKNPKYQIFVFHSSPKLIEDMVMLSNQTYTDESERA